MNKAIKHVVQEPPRQEGSGVLNKNTGFPEPLSHNSNTTLPHPSADTSPTASIESVDVPVSRSHARHSSFHLARITSHNSNAAKERGRHQPSITASDNGPNGGGGGSSSGPSYGNGTLPHGTGADPGKRDFDDMNGISAGAGAGTSSAATAIALLDGEGRGRGADRERDEQGYREGERKKGLLRKLQLHKV